MQSFCPSTILSQLVYDVCADNVYLSEIFTKHKPYSRIRVCEWRIVRLQTTKAIFFQEIFGLLRSSKPVKIRVWARKLQLKITTKSRTTTYFFVASSFHELRSFLDMFPDLHSRRQPINQDLFRSLKISCAMSPIVSCTTSSSATTWIIALTFL